MRMGYSKVQHHSKSAKAKVFSFITLITLVLSTVLVPVPAKAAAALSSADMPAFAGNSFEAVNGNVPFFTAQELQAAGTSYESYGKKDYLGRCTQAVASVGVDLMPTTERGAIGNVRPTGWHQKKYDWIDGKYLYNRCHLIGYQLTGENANTDNLITGTRELNINSMLLFENMTADYVKETGNHVLYRVTPVFDGSNMLASGVLMEGESVEDGGAGILFCVYCYNYEPGVTINYADGTNAADGTMGASTATTASQASAAAKQTVQAPAAAAAPAAGGVTYVLNVKTHKFHRTTCKNLPTKNRMDSTESRDQIVAEGYTPCGNCHP